MAVPSAGAVNREDGALLLGSHPEINGYDEMHISYEDASVLGKQREGFLQGDAIKENSRYLFDKLLHTTNC